MNRDLEPAPRTRDRPRMRRGALRALDKLDLSERFLQRGKVQIHQSALTGATFSSVSLT